MASTLVYCVRHGQTTENVKGIIQGQLDTQLNSVGIQEAAAVARSLRDAKFDIAFSSDLTRAVDTANAILRYHAGISLRQTAALRERFMGNLQGQPAFQNQKRLPLDETVETSVAFIDRILKFWDERVIPYAKKVPEMQDDRPRSMLVVSHGAFINSLARAIVKHRNIIQTPEVQISWCPNASVTLIEVQMDGTGSLRSFGDVSHMVTPVTVGNADDLSELDSLYARKK